jgi:SWI/SNF-related matrix-associated actin-dependent regulator of chromatin subfamily B member 1
VQDDDLRLSLLPSLSTGARSMDQVVAFTPRLDYLSDGELERNEKEREKELNRRRRKTTRGRRGIALPDREPPKTYRTPAIGFPEVDAATLALVNANAAPMSRRAAAAAASHTIASMIASENGTSLSPQMMPVPIPTTVAPAPAKEKKPKGLMKPPNYPQSVLRPRAHVKAPTPSTAANPSTVPPPLDIDMPVAVNVPENRGARVPVTAKRAKELEREAKEREYMDGQHANYIDGVWHCSNCGCPESIAIGRRKGPLGDKSQCGTCGECRDNSVYHLLSNAVISLGKYWHRHRRPRPVEYNSSLEYHQNLKREEEQVKIAASRRKRPHAHQVEAASSKAPTVEPETPRKGTPGFSDDKPLSQRTHLETPRLSKAEKTEQPGSPMSTTSSISEAPLSQRVKPNGVGHSASSAPGMAPSQSESSESIQDTPQDSPTVLPSVSTPGGTARPAAGRPTRVSRLSPRVTISG